MDSCHHHPLGPLIDIRGRTTHPESIIYQANLSYTKFSFKWDPIQLEGNEHLQKYEETNGSISYLKSNMLKQLVSLKINMIVLICQDRPADQNYHPIDFIKGEQLLKLTAIDLKTALIN